MSSRRESSYLRDILAATGKIAFIISQTSEVEFLADEVRQAAVLHHLAVIGEAVSQLSPELKTRYPDVAWHQIAAVRHRIVHAYFDLDWQILWGAATDDVPRLRARVEEILQTDFPD